MRRLTLIVVLVAFTLSCGAQWPVLQCVAWLNMIREYSEIVPVAKAVQMTFSGHYPCALCRAIAEKKRSQDTKTATLLQRVKKIFAQGLTVPSRTTNVSPPFFNMPAPFW